MGYKMAHSAFLDLMTTPVQNRSYEKQCFESGPIWSIVVLTEYNSIVIYWKSSFHRVLARIVQAIVWKKIQIYISKFERDICKILRGSFHLAHPINA
jgi:hypothetical protein